MQSHVSSKEKHIEQGLHPKMGVAMAIGLNVTSQHEDLAKRHYPCLPIDACDFLCCDEPTSPGILCSVLASGDQESMEKSQTMRKNAT